MKSTPRYFVLPAATFLFLFTLFQAWADYPGLVSSYNPLAYWRLDETAASPAPAIATNSSSLGALGNGYVVLDALQGQSGVIGNSVRFNNPTVVVGHCGSKIDVPYNAVFNPNAPFTVEFWAKANALGGDTTGTCPLSSFNSQAFNSSEGLNDSDRAGYLFYLNNAGRWEFRLGRHSGYLLVLDATSGNAVPGTWQHIVAAWDGTNASLYINGALAGSAPADAGSWEKNAQMFLRLGGTPLVGDASTAGLPFTTGGVLSGNRGFDGWLDEVALYGTALSASTVAAHFSAATTNVAGYHAQILSSSPILYLGLDEPTVVAPDPSTYPLIVNSGTLGAEANGTNIWGVVDNQAGAGYVGFGATNKAVVLNSESGNIAIMNSPGLHFATNAGSQITMMAWVKPQIKDYVRSIIAHGVDNNHAETFLRINADADYVTTADDGFGDDGKFYEVGSSDGSTFYANAYIQVPAGDIGNWVFLAGTYDGANWNLYRNGLLVSSIPAIDFLGNPLASAVVDVTNAWSLGAESNPSAVDGLRFGGSIDEPAIFNTALQPADIMAIYNAAQVPPVITTAVQPPVGTVFAGSSLSFSVLAEGSPSLTYSWLFNGVPTGDTTTNYTTGNLTVGTDTIAVVVTNPYGVVTNGVTFAVVAAPPFFIQPPVAETRFTGYPFSFSVVAGGSTPISYQWKSNNVIIPGATSPIYSGVASPAVAFNYSCTLSNVAGISNSVPVPLTVLAIPGGYPGAVIASGPIAYYRLGETNGTVAHDYIGGLDGTYFSVTLGQPGYSAFDPDTAVLFNGVNSYAGNINGTLLNFSGHTNFTIEAWVKGAPGQADESTITAKGAGANGTVATEQFSLDIAAGVYRFFTRGSASAIFGASATEGPNNTWQHVVGVYNDGEGTMAIYVNGVQEGIGTPRAAGLRASSDQVTIGSKHLGNEPAFDGSFVGEIDELAFYPTALDSGTIAAHYSSIYGSNTRPFFTKQPSALTNYAGLSATFAAAGAGTVPLSYQWYKGGSPISGANSSSFTISPLATTDAGSYYLQIINSVGTTNSIAVPLTVLTAPTNPPAIEGLVLHMPFEGDATDATGRGNNATIVGPPTFAKDGQIGEAFSYVTDITDTNNPIYNYAIINAPGADLQFSSNVNFSVSLWIRLPANYTAGDLPFFCSASGSTFGTGLVLAPSYGSTAVPPPTTAYNGGWAMSLFDASGNGLGVYGDIGSINDGGWHHLAYVFDRVNGFVCYLDGEVAAYSKQAGTTITAAGNVDTGGPFGIGQDPTGTYPQTASADIDDLAVYRKSLTALEAASIFVAGATNGVGVSSSSFLATPLTFQTLPGNQLKLMWGAAGTLQSADTVNGPYTTVATVSPFTVPTTASKKFYRVKL